MKKVIRKTIEKINKYIFLVAPIITLIIFLLLAKRFDLAPIGSKTIAWCDMEQQVVPLLNDFKDILSGKQSISYNMNNAGGMSFFGVVFFFVSSPISLLVVFVDKTDMLAFVNVIVMIKLIFITGTSSFYLKKKYPKLNTSFNIALALLYTFSGYSMMYYQNQIWLDIVCLFPLLMLSIDYLIEKDKIVPYVILCALIVMINYYIGAIVVFFILLYVGLTFFVKRKEENIKTRTFHFIFASFTAALISMIVLIPSFVDYLKSARTISITDSIKNSWILTSFVTTLPLIFGTLILIPLFFSKKNNNEKRIKLILLILLFIPLMIDPINKMWHLGSYQSFPCRFAFILTFLFIDIAAMSIQEVNDDKFTKKTLIKNIIGGVISICLIIFAYVFENKYVSKKIDDLDNYATSLWGNTTSLEALIRYYVIILIVSAFIYILFKTKLINKRMLGVSYVSLAVLDAIFSFRIYAVVPSRKLDSYKDYYQLANVIEDDSFYRVKTKEKYRNVNDLGALGYNNLGHYTSLTNKEYMFTMKKLGYSSYWMEVGAYGGSSFTDALLLNKYTITYGKDKNALYTTDKYHITENKVFPFGIVTHSDLSQDEELEVDSRVNMQELMYSRLIDSDTSLHTVYERTSFKNVEIKEENNNFTYSVSGTGEIEYSFHVDGVKSLYFEAFDKYSNALKEGINETMRIYCNGRYVKSNYPSQGYNGTISLGIFENQDVNVKIEISNSISGSSFSVFGIDESLLEEKINNVAHGDFTYSSKKNTFKGNYQSDGEEYVFLPLAYTTNMKAKINGKKVEVNRVFSSFAMIKLVEGNNNIEIYFTQKGLGLGIGLFIVGAALLGAYIYLDKKQKNQIINNQIACKISFIFIEVVSGIVFIALYIIPLILNVFNQIS